jgi:hypothetical protein
MTSKKSKKNANPGDADRLYDDGPETFESSKRETLDKLKDSDIERQWKEIFDSPEFGQELGEADFRDVPKSRPDERTPIVSGLLSATFENKLRIIREAIQEIEREIEERIGLGKAFRNRIDSEVSKCKAMLKLIEDFAIGYNPSIEMRRLNIERQIFTLTRELRSEDLRAWEDITSLMKERRTLDMEYKALLNTRKVLSTGKGNGATP